MRADVVGWIASLVPVREWHVRVAVDGGDGAGKTWLADELGEALRALGRPVVRVGVDDFHRPRAERYRRGRQSPEGFWLDSFDYARLRSDVLSPFGPGGDGRYRDRAHDLASDELLDPPWRQAPDGAVLVLDGLFLHRDGLAGLWDLSVFIEASDASRFARMASRDGTPDDPDDPANARYLGAHRLYVAACDPASRADVVVDNTEPERLRVVRGRLRGGLE
ncbi:MAG: uridine kinase [Actinobacteria bacterium]|jgi:uridine kinase|nr:uridine kinase [Actinomycetota bacterium]